MDTFFTTRWSKWPSFCFRSIRPHSVPTQKKKPDRVKIIKYDLNNHSVIVQKKELDVQDDLMKTLYVCKLDKAHD